MVIVLASERLGKNDNQTYELVGDQIAELVQEGHLEAIGDVSQWRHSEVRLPSPHVR